MTVLRGMERFASMFVPSCETETIVQADTHEAASCRAELVPREGVNLRSGEGCGMDGALASCKTHLSPLLHPSEQTRRGPRFRGRRWGTRQDGDSKRKSRTGEVEPETPLSRGYLIYASVYTVDCIWYTV